MVGRPDEKWGLIQQAIYLALILALLVVEIRELKGPLTVPRWFAKVWHYREEVQHFFLGTLLNMFTIFYFKSSSFVGAFLFFIVISGCLVANEASAVRKYGLSLRTALFAICFSSYLFCLVPILWGAIGVMQFATSLVLSPLVFAAVLWAVIKVLGERERIVRQVALPYGGVIALFLFLYIFRLIPPVPLSLTHIGIYHQVDRAAGGYKVSYEKPFWRFWETGDQTFKYRPGDRIYCFFSVFSPGGFRDSVKIRWLHKDDKRGWQYADAVPVNISGGREEGYRGFAYKANYQPGPWQIRIETRDEREIGRIDVTVLPDDRTDERLMQERVL